MKALNDINIPQMKCTKTLGKLHEAAVSRLAFHPKIPVMASQSDDGTWKLLYMPQGEVIMQGEGHKDWVSGIQFSHNTNQEQSGLESVSGKTQSMNKKFNTSGLIGTTSGDTTVKLWDIQQEKCVDTFTDHVQQQWSCAFYEHQDLLISSSMDQTCKLYDLNALKCVKTLRGHVDSVNCVGFQKFGLNVCTQSGDKTVSLWDLT